jgi:hypothetical protein
MKRFCKWVTRVRVVYFARVNYYVWKTGRAACADKRVKRANRLACDALYSDRSHRCEANRFLVRILTK